MVMSPLTVATKDSFSSLLEYAANNDGGRDGGRGGCGGGRVMPVFVNMQLYDLPYFKNAACFKLFRLMYWKKERL
ncbi:hypothetical protein Hanom_Chr12g01161791 [Helianthus anomalus]